MNAQNVFATFYVRFFYRNLTVETAGTKQCRVKNIGAVGCGKQNQTVFVVKTVHFYQHLVQGLLTLIMTAAHANACLQPDQTPVFPEDDAPLREMLGDGYRCLSGKNVIPFGAGRVIFYAQKEYPSSESIREDYLAEMKVQSDLAVAGERETGWVDTMEGVDFAIWQDGSLRTAYVIDADWYSHQPGRFSLLFGDRAFEMVVKPFELKTIRMSEGLAVCAVANTSDVLDIRKEQCGWTVTVQTAGPDVVSVYFRDSGETREIRVDSAGIHEIAI